MSKASTLERQRKYVERIEKEGFDFGLTVAASFVRSIRDLGYRNCATALDELVDNSVEQGAENVHVAFGLGKSGAKPESLAVIDDGYGMVPTMVRASVIWGGTDREGSRSLFGRYGYGLPSASVSQGRRFTVFSRTEEGPFVAVTVDTDEIAEGKHLVDNRVVIPPPVESELPDWVRQYAQKHFPGGVSAVRTVVVWEKLDRLTWKTKSVLEPRLLEHFGLIYRGFLRQTRIVVNGREAEPLDPLFTTPGARYYDLDSDRAVALPPLTFQMKDAEGVEHTVTLRMSTMPPTFFAVDKTKKASGKNANPRLAVRRDTNGFVVCRNGRQIDVVTRNPITTFVNYDRNIGLELDFPAALDEEFGVTTAKQSITISDRVWDKLRDAGFPRILESARRAAKEDRDDVEASTSPGTPRPSESTMEQAEEIIRRRPDAAEAEQEAEENLNELVKDIVKETGVAPDVVRETKEVEAKEQPYKVVVESLPGGPFFRVKPVGGQTILYLNKSHRFFTDVYSAVKGQDGARMRAALELLLFAIGLCELDAPKAVRAMYASEKVEWSNRLAVLLELLDADHDSAQDFEDELEAMTAGEEAN